MSLGEAAPLVPAGLAPLALGEEPEPEPELELEGALVGETPLDPEGTAAELEPAAAGEEAEGGAATGTAPPGVEPEEGVDSGLVPDAEEEGEGEPEPASQGHEHSVDARRKG